MKTRLTSSLAAAGLLLLATICHAQQTDGSVDESVVDNNPNISSRPAPASGANAAGAETWRMVNHQGNWWYYHPNGSWSSWDGARWNPYNNAEAGASALRNGSSTNTAATGTNASASPASARGRNSGTNSGDVEQSGATLGLGSGPNYASGLAPRGIGAMINGKGAPPGGGAGFGGGALPATKNVGPNAAGASKKTGTRDAGAGGSGS
jgi:hypothetical protein